jgi:lipooligosaccharide transport system permease protein
VPETRALVQAAPGEGLGTVLRRTLRVVEYCARVYRRSWRGTLFITFLAPVLFLGAMGFGLGGFIDRSGGLPGGVPYAVFLAPGLLAAQGMQTAAFESTYPIMGRTVWNRVYGAMLATPIGVPEIVVGQLAWIGIRLLLVTSVFFGVMVAFGLVGSPLAVLAVGAATLTGLAFAAPIMAFTATQRNDQGFNALFRFGITPLFLFSGTFFPVEELPGFLQPVAWLTPTYHGVALARDLALGWATPFGVGLHLGVLVGLTLAGLGAALVTFRRALIV